MNGFGSLNVKLFTMMTPPPNSEGGLLNAIVGSLMMSTLAVLAGTPLGLLAGTYLAEYGGKLCRGVGHFVHSSAYIDFAQLPRVMYTKAV